MTWRDRKMMLAAIISLVKSGGKEAHRDDYRTNAPAPEEVVAHKVKEKPQKEKLNVFKSISEFDKEYPRIAAMIYMVSSSTLAGLTIGFATQGMADGTALSTPFKYAFMALGASFCALCVGSIVALVNRADRAGHK